MSIWSRRATQQPTVLAATRRDGAESNGPMPLLSALGQVDEAQAASACSGAHLFVGSPRNIDILLRTLLLELHPTLPPSHTCLVIKQVLDLLECAKHVEHSVALEIALAAEVGRTLAQNALDLPWLGDQLRVAGHEHRRSAAHVWRRHARSVELSPLSLGQARSDTLARRDQVRLHPAVAGRSAAREKTHAVGMRPEAVRRPDGDDPVGIARIRNAVRGIAFVRAFLGLEAVVAQV